MIVLFIKKLVTFLAVFIIIITIILLLSSVIADKQMNYKLSKNIDVLVLGDSHTQCAVNDQILQNTLNLSESADTYLYSFIKLKKILPGNPQIKQVVLGYANHNISKKQDLWLVDETINTFKLPLHFFMFDYDDFEKFSVLNPTQIPINALKIIKINSLQIIRSVKKTPINKFGIGGFLALQKPSKNNEKSDNKNIINHNIEFSTIDIENLVKIYKLCEEKKIKLSLINTPSLVKTTTKELAFEKYLFQYQKDNLQNATILNHSKLIQEKIYFADNSHLNKNGAHKYSEFLKLNNILEK